MDEGQEPGVSYDAKTGITTFSPKGLGVIDQAATTAPGNVDWPGGEPPKPRTIPVGLRIRHVLPDQLP